MSRSSQEDAEKFACILKRARLRPLRLKFGKFHLKGKHGIADCIRYSRRDFPMLKGAHDYTFDIRDGPLQVSLQLYENTSNYYRLFCYSRIHDTEGMLFSVNLTLNKVPSGLVPLTQKIRFFERWPSAAESATRYRKAKQTLFVNLLSQFGFRIEGDNDLVLGVFDAKAGRLREITAEKLVHDFLVVSILKGHFMENKGYSLEMLPSGKKLHALLGAGIPRREPH